MQVLDDHKKVLFGLKLKQLRQDAKFSLAQLAKKSGISASYLNEIEKGRKFPKEQKLIDLASALEVSYPDLTSMEMKGRLAPLAEIFSNQYLSDLPLDVFGIDFIRLGDWMGQTPSKAGAFINAILQIAKSYNLNKEAFYFASLRAYQELNNNYFQDLEDEVSCFLAESGLSNLKMSPALLKDVLEKTFSYSIKEMPESPGNQLGMVRSVYNKAKKQLYINPNLNKRQQLFVLAKELGFSVLDLKDRSLYPLSIGVESFTHLLNNFKAAYFAGALLVPKEAFLKQMEELMTQEKWKSSLLQTIISEFQVSPELFAHRTSGLIPEAFGLKSLYYQRFQKDRIGGSVKITRELHINGAQTPHANQVDQTYCNRWRGVRSLADLGNKSISSNETKIAVQRSKFYNSNKEYFVVSLSRHLYPTRNTDSCVAIGFAMTNAFKERVKFWDDDQIEHRIVNITCETCGISDCEDRTAKPTVFDRKEKSGKIRKALDDIL